MDEPDEILQRIMSAYGSLFKPTYWFMSRVVAERPYDALIDSIRSQFEVEDDTDVNYDRSFTYVLQRQRCRWALRLSMVGPYAVVARIDAAWRDILTATTPDVSEAERWLLDKVGAAKLRLLSRRELERPVALRLYDVEPENVRIYQALFEESDILPWDLETLRGLGLL